MILIHKVVLYIFGGVCQCDSNVEQHYSRCYVGDVGISKC